MALVAFQNVSFRYPGATRDALSDVSFEIPQGSFTLVMGPTGCGKTTLLRSMKTVLAPYGERSGRVLFDGRPLDDVPEREQVARIGFVMQNPEAQLVTDKVWHELAFGLESLGCDQATMRRRVAEMASFFGIQHWFHKNVAELSGGQKQLLNLASVMVMQPDVLVLDEPTSQLDPIAAGDFLNTVRRLNLELGVTVVMTEHRLEEAYGAADLVVALENGRIVALGEPRVVASALWDAESSMVGGLPASARVYFGVEGDEGRPVEPKGEGAPCSDSIEVFHSRSGFGVDSNTSMNCARTPSSLGSACSAVAAMGGSGMLGGFEVPLTVREGRQWLAAAVEGCELGSPAAAARRSFSDSLAVWVRDVWFRYEREGDDVLRGATLEVPSGSLFAVVGGNGTGKSTLLKALCGVVKPYRGKIEVLGWPLKAWKGSDLFRGGVALLPQDPLNLMVKKTVRGDLLEMLEGRGLSDEDARVLLDDAVAKASAGGLLDAHPYDLSGGELQRAALAKVLLCQPRLLLLDEPTRGLDALHKQHLACTLADLTAAGTTVLMVSHDVEFCAAHADLAALFFDGDVVSSGPARPFFAGNSFYTTVANRMSRGIIDGAVTVEEVIARCLG
ncbi:MAG: ATP-binding cassette domain-containing protein [Adlercreutzia sp.]|nr:ATP-binding cassette domain-containing protein [Adlercreutzia sp.]